MPSGEAQVGRVSYLYPDLGAGVCWSYGVDQKQLFNQQDTRTRAIVGFSVWHLGIPNYSFSQQNIDKLHTKIVFHGNLELGKKGSLIKLIPEFLFVSQGKLKELNVGCRARYLMKEGSQITGRISGYALSLGANYRYKDAFIISSLMEVGSWAVGLSYDITTSKLRKATNGNGGFEIALRFVTPNPFGASGKYRF
jgi:hypothetical protein